MSTSEIFPMIYIRWNVIGHCRAECFLQRARCLESITIACYNISHYLTLERLRIILSAQADMRELQNALVFHCEIFDNMRLSIFHFCYDRLITRIQPHLSERRKILNEQLFQFLTTKFQARSPLCAYTHAPPYWNHVFRSYVLLKLSTRPVICRYIDRLFY